MIKKGDGHEAANGAGAVNVETLITPSETVYFVHANGRIIECSTLDAARATATYLRGI